MKATTKGETTGVAPVPEKGKRGRKPKAAIWDAAPQGEGVTLDQVEQFRATVRQTFGMKSNGANGRDEKTLEIMKFWLAEYRRAGGRMVNGKHVKGSDPTTPANSETAKKFHLSETRIQQIITEIEDASERLAKWNAEHAAAPPVLPPQEVAGIAAELLRARQALAAAEHCARHAEARAKAAETALETIKQEIAKLDRQQVLVGATKSLKKYL